MIMDFRAMLELEETPEILGKITESTETRGARDTEGFKGY